MGSRVQKDQVRVRASVLFHQTGDTTESAGVDGPHSFHIQEHHRLWQLFYGIVEELRFVPINDVADAMHERDTLTAEGTYIKTHRRCTSLLVVRRAAVPKYREHFVNRA